MALKSGPDRMVRLGNCEPLIFAVVLASRTALWKKNQRLVQTAVRPHGSVNGSCGSHRYLLKKN